MSKNEPKITKISVHQFQFEVRDMGTDYNGFNAVYEPGARRMNTGNIVRIETDQGITGEYLGGDSSSLAQIGSFAHYLKGRNALEREQIHFDLKRACRKNDRFGIGPIDCALWDIAGKFYDAPVWQLLGGWRKSVPCYASTYHGDNVKGGLNSPEAYAEFGVECREIGYPGMKIHPWGKMLGSLCNLALD